ncbi:RIP metalloprotease RseP [Lachnospiraceae bacterium M18-1]|nr:RIP metalloprotease RseP [Lachnospiraceae bacterium M18-1]
MGIVIAILLFSGIVIFHELGHFLLAKANKIHVDEFSLGLGPTLFGKVIGGTKFSLKLLPFGGACMMGEDEAEEFSAPFPRESHVHTGEETDVEEVYLRTSAEGSAEDPSEGSFNSKSVWARISVIAAGPIFNLILAWILCVIMVAWVGYRAPVVGEVSDGYSAKEQGIRAGDTITRIDGKRIYLWDEITLANLMNSEGGEIEITYQRDGKETTVVLEPRALEGDLNKRLGITSTAGSEKTGILGSLQYGAYTVRYWINYTMDCLKMLVGGKVGIRDMSGPVGIVDAVDATYQSSRSAGIQILVLNLLNFAILLTANLGIMNLLPIPALDGGRLVFLFMEAVRGKRVPPEKEGMVHFAGLAVLMVLMVVVMYNDIIKLL